MINDIQQQNSNIGHAFSLGPSSKAGVCCPKRVSEPTSTICDIINSKETVGKQHWLYAHTASLSTLSQLHHKGPYAASHCSRSHSSNWASSPNSICIGHATKTQTHYWKMMKCLSCHLNHDVATARTLGLENLAINKSTGPQMTVGPECRNSKRLSTFGCKFGHDDLTHIKQYCQHSNGSINKCCIQYHTN